MVVLALVGGIVVWFLVDWLARMVV